MLCTRYALRGERDLYHIESLSDISILTLGKNIELQSNISTKRDNDAFSSQENIADDENEELFKECDDVFYEHEQLIIDMIYEAAKNFAL